MSTTQPTLTLSELQKVSFMLIFIIIYNDYVLSNTKVQTSEKFIKKKSKKS